MVKDLNVPVTHLELKQELKKFKKEFKEEIKSELYEIKDEIVGEIRAMREEFEMHMATHSRINDTLDDHEERLTLIEKKPH